MPVMIVAIPAYNEETAIAGVIRRIKRNLDCYDESLVLVVDDGSGDRTAEVAVKSGANIVVKHSRNMGVACAYRTAIQSALKYGADIVCTIDADGQFNPDDLHKLVAPIKNGNTDLVIGSRFIDCQAKRQVPITNLVANKLMATLVSALIGTRVYDVESGYRALSREAAMNLNLLGRVSFSHDMIIDLSRQGFRISEVPVEVKYFTNRSSRAIPGFLRYGLKSLGVIVMKALSIPGFLSGLSRNQPSIETICELLNKTE